MGKITWVSGVLTLAISIALAVLTSVIFKETGQGILDTEILGHTAQSVDQILSAYQGTPALTTYKKIQHLDLIYLVTYGVFGFSLLYQVFKPSVWRFSGVTMIISAVFDFLENGVLANIVLSYPEVDPDMISRINFYTQAKYFLVAISLALLAVGMVRYLQRKRISR